MSIFGFKLIKLKKRKYPICPECGKDTIVLFSPPDRPMSIYCCNGSSNCRIDTPISELTTPRKP